MHNQLLQILSNIGLISLIALLVVVSLLVVMYIFFKALFVPIKLMDKHNQDRDQAYQELLEIQAEKAIEWDKYKDLQDEKNRLMKQNLSLKKENDRILEDLAKIEQQNDALKAKAKVAKGTHKAP